MYSQGSGFESCREAHIPSSKIEFGFLRIQEEAFVPGSAGSPAGCADQLCRSFSPVGVSGTLVQACIGDHLAERRPLSDPLGTQQGIRPCAQERWLAPHRPDQRPVRIAQSWHRNAHSVIQPGVELCDTPWCQPHIGIEDEIGVTFAGSSHCCVDASGVTHVGSGLD